MYVLAVTIIDYRNYPFLADLKDILNYRWPGLKLSDIISMPNNYPRLRAMVLLKSIVSKRKILPPKSTSEDEVLAFYTLISIVKLLKDKKLSSIVAVTYAKHAYRYLQNEPVNTLLKISNILGIKAELSRNYPLIPIDLKRNKPIFEPRPIGIDLKDYLKLTAKRLARDPKYSLVNQVVHRGKVFLNKKIFSRILEEAIHHKILDIIENIKVEENKFRELLEEARKILDEIGWMQKRMLDIEIEKNTEGVIDFEAFPPCMKILLNRLRSGENLGHHERFTIAAFLARIGMDIDSMLEFFKNAPDFNEKIARYQLEHIAGLKGSRKKYLPYSCESMKTLNLCPINGQCRGGKNPLAVYKYNVRMKYLKKTSKETKTKQASR